jgi:heme/copper-type cytochrome/quinol oxidase subunit 4
MADEKDYHGKQNYVMLLGMIGLLVVAMVVVSKLGMNRSTSVMIIAGLGAVQFYLVLANLMHLKYEPALINLVAYLSVVFILLFIFGVAPDTLMIPLKITE